MAATTFGNLATEIEQWISNDIEISISDCLRVSFNFLAGALLSTYVSYRKRYRGMIDVLFFFLVRVHVVVNMQKLIVCRKENS